MLKELEMNDKYQLIMREDLATMKGNNDSSFLENLQETFASDRNAFDILYIIHTAMKIIKTDSCVVCKLVSSRTSQFLRSSRYM